MKLLLLGAGYVGMPLLHALKEQGHELAVATTSAEKVPNLAPYGQVLLLGDLDTLRNGIDACEGLLILVAPKNRASYAETYLATAQNVQNALKTRTRPLYLLYTSSTSVYEGVSTEWADEGTPLSPPSENGRILLDTETLYLQHTDSCILRLGGIYGPGRDLQQRARHMSGKEISGFGNEFTNHIHRDDIVRAICFSLDHRLRGIYNLVNNDHPSRKALYNGLCNALHLPPPIWQPAPAGPAKPKVSNQKLAAAGFTWLHPTTAE